MKRFLIIISILLAAQITQAGHHENGKMLAKRQPDTSMTITSVNLGQDQTTITATGDMGVYGKVYLTYNLTYNAERNGGPVTGQGRGATAEGIASGIFAGHWYLDGSKVIMRNVVQINDGTQNLDVITFDAAKSTLVVEVYILK
jgi:hypothetical protein